MSKRVSEVALYAPVKRFLENQGYDVKGEVGPADVVAMRSDLAAPVIVELKTGFSLVLFHQAIERLALSDTIYIAVPREAGKRWQKSLRANIRLCRRLGIGLMTVRLEDFLVEVHADPGPYAPRKNTRKQDMLLREFAKRKGDPNEGGTAGAIVTAYRQDAVKLYAYLVHHGPSRGRDVAQGTGVVRATQMMRANHYGWFEKVDVGIYMAAADCDVPEL